MSSSRSHGTYEKVRAGVYLRFAPNITVGCPKGTGARKHWSPRAWSAGQSTRFWDITIDRETMVALEYALAARGILSPRKDELVPD
jgi:hypothetical protein